MTGGPRGYTSAVPRRRHDLRRLPTRELLHLWHSSATLLRAVTDARHATLLVARRQQYLDELWRRGAAAQSAVLTPAES
jgi:hypothetical protein